mmetsp:Transcript_77512/g.157394  ORF Transcript_77512/g.157394 Transcript_77512/m.157394 type:complete len:463 (+) Transcript_77512:70-1458(+)
MEMITKAMGEIFQGKRQRGSKPIIYTVLIAFVLILCEISRIPVETPHPIQEVKYSTSSGQRRPLAVIHVGPHKTGSTHIQTILFGSSEKFGHRLKKELAKDNYVIPELPYGGQHKNTAHLAACLNPKRDIDVPNWCKKDQRPTIMEAFQNFVQTTAASFDAGKKNGSVFEFFPTSFLMSSEEFDRPFSDQAWLVDLIQPSFDMHILLFYRPFYSWLASLHNEYYKSDFHGKQYRISPISEWVTELQLSKNSTGGMHTYHLYERWTSRLPESSVRVLDADRSSISSTRSMEEAFFCQGVPDSKHACSHVRKKLADEQEAEEKHTNPSVTLEPMDLMRAISSRYEISDGGDRRQQLSMIQRRWEELLAKQLRDGGMPVQRKCVSEALQQRILELSLFYENFLFDKIVVADKNSTNGDKNAALRSLEEGFRRKAPTLFCSVDADWVLGIWETQDWFRQFVTNGVV